MKQLLFALTLAFTFSAQAKNVDLTASKFGWLGTKVTGKHVGNISLKSANLKLDKKGSIQNGTFVIDMNSITVTDLSGDWAKKFLDHIKGGDFFEVKKHPTAKLVIKKDDGKNIHGDLTIKGKTNPVKIPYTKKGKEYKGTLKFDRTKFDMIYGSGNFFKNLGDKAINNEVALTFNVKVK